MPDHLAFVFRSDLKPAPAWSWLWLWLTVDFIEAAFTTNIHGLHPEWPVMTSRQFLQRPCGSSLVAFPHCAQTLLAMLGHLHWPAFPGSVRRTSQPYPSSALGAGSAIVILVP